jgi:cell division septal protein FtsQ
MNNRSEERETAKRHGNAPVLTQTEARQAVTPHVTRYVLVWGLALVIVAFAIIYALHHLAHP